MKRLIAVLRNPWFGRAYLLVLFSCGALFFYSHREEFPNTVSDSDPQFIFLAMIAYSVAVAIIAPTLHRMAYNEIGVKVSFWQAFRIFHLSHIGNYLPGKVWFATNYFLFSKSLKISTDKIARNFFLINALFLFVGAICSLPVIYLFKPDLLKFLIALPLLMLIIINPKTYDKLFSLFFKHKAHTNLRRGFLINAAILFFILFLLLGLSLYLCMLAFEVVELQNLPVIISSASSGVVLGILAFFAPAGVGVTEGVNTAILAHLLPLHSVLAAVLGFRLVMVIADFSCALVSAASLTRKRKGSAWRSASQIK